jgi:acetolactate decarboxylase
MIGFLFKRVFRLQAVGLILLAAMVPTYASEDRPAVVQISTIDALLAGSYDGVMRLDTLLEYGDFGLGTFDRLDGEMLVYQGEIFQIKADGKAYRPDLALTTPFATVIRFEPNHREMLKGQLDFPGLQAVMDVLAPQQNHFVALAIEGEFARMHVRSVPAQEKPYPPLAEVAARQPEFHFENVRGLLVGFRCPAFVRGINVPGYHLHFIDDDRTVGGHVLDFILTEGEVEWAVADTFTMILPDPNDVSFQGLDLTRDRVEELHRIESPR